MKINDNPSIRLSESQSLWQYCAKMGALLENRGHSTIRSARVPNSPQAIPAKSRFSGTPRWTKSDPERVWYSFLRISSIDLHNNCCYEIIDLAGENCDSFFKLSPFAPREYIFYLKLGVHIHLVLIGVLLILCKSTFFLKFSLLTKKNQY